MPAPALAGAPAHADVVFRKELALLPIVDPDKVHRTSLVAEEQQQVLSIADWQKSRAGTVGSRFG